MLLALSDEEGVEADCLTLAHLEEAMAQLANQDLEVQTLQVCSKKKCFILNGISMPFLLLGPDDVGPEPVDRRDPLGEPPRPPARHSQLRDGLRGIHKVRIF